jgi:hypothetical protein
VTDKTRARRIADHLLRYFGLRGSLRAPRPIVTVLMVLLAVLWITDAAISGALTQWLLAAAWAVIAAGHVWMNLRPGPSRLTGERGSDDPRA